MNGQETEVKFFVRDLKRIEMRLRDLKAHLIQPRVHEANLRFDNSNDDLRRELKVLRLRKDTEAKFTFKGPSQENQEGILRRQELEFTVSDFDTAKEFLHALGFRTVAFYEKFRTTYDLNGAHVMLDELPFGNFVEIEGEDVTTLRKNAELLGLDWDTSVKAGYLALFEKITEKYRLEPGQLSFDALRSVQVSGEDMGITFADRE
ncbi:MAG: class IV adenylate cyclase [Anaerolineales bacterium]|nr:class IV adenylate cyclase [Anaerolineales bacterium]